MLGLLLKDLYVIKKQGKSILLVLVFYFIFSIVTHNFQMFTIFTVLFTIMTPMTVMTYDERSKCDKLMLCMPIERKDIVISLYLFGILLFCASILINIMVLLFHPTGQTDNFSLFLYSSCCLFYFSVYMPFAFKLGPEKSRYLMLGAIAIPGFFLLLIYQFKDLPVIQAAASWLYTQNQGKLSAYILMASVLSLIPSIFISIHVYKTKEV